MEKYFWKTITLLGQWPWVLLWPLLLYVVSYYTDLGLSYPTLADDPFVISLFAGLLMSYGAGSVIKLLFYKPRPIPQPFHNRLQKIDASSFPSVHTTNASVVGIIWSRRWHQSMKWGWDSLLIVPLIVAVVWTCAAIALSRIALDKHYPIDVLSGMLLGVLICAVLGLAYVYGFFYRR